MRAPLLALPAALALSAVLGGCGKTLQAASVAVRPGAIAAAPAAEGALGVVTANTTRLGGADPAADAAAVALAVYPGLTANTRPQSVVLVDERSWPDALAASALAAAPLDAPLLFTDGDSLPRVTAKALRALRPLGAPALGGVQVIRVGTSAPVPDGYSTRTLAGAGRGGASAAASASGAAIAVEVEQLVSVAERRSPARVMVLADEAQPALQMPAAGLSAESGAPILLAGTGAIPAVTVAALAGLHRPTIYVLDAPALGSAALAELARLGTLKRIGNRGAAGGSTGASEGSGAVESSIAVARFADGSFGWSVHESGHGFVFANASRPLDGPAAAPLSAHGDYAPLLVLESSASVSAPLARYLIDIEPGYTRAIPPVRGVYNHGWLIGDERAVSTVVQAELDTLLEIAPRSESEVQAAAPSTE